jgi:hypothetical protein
MSTAYSRRPRSSLKRPSHHLKRLVEEVVSERFGLPSRGLALLVDAIEASGKPVERIRVWATLHFLSLGSPFYCGEPSCHVPLFGSHLDEIGDVMRRRLRLRSKVSVEFVTVGICIHDGVVFDDLLGARTPVVEDSADLDKRDALGRTALMRAAVRGYDRQVEQLLAAGADPNVRDSRGRGILEQVRRNSWIFILLEQALSKSPLTGGS